MTIKTLKTAACAGALMSAVAWSGGAFAAGASGDSYDFETSGTLGTGTYVDLAGNGEIATESYTAPRIGGPISSSSTKVLQIAGTVTYTNSASSAPSTSSQVDFMFKVEPTDELESIDDTTVQVALAVGTNFVASGDSEATSATIKLWCKGPTNEVAAGAASWYDIKTVGTGSWVRATLVMNYGDTRTCKVSIDGDYCGDYYFAGGASSTFVKSISMVGSTSVDELKVSYDAPESYHIPVPAGGNTTIADSGQGSNVTYDYINKYGVTVAEATSATPLNAESGMSVADKFAAGLNPKSPTKFEMQSMTMTSATTATIKFPGNIENGYTVKATSDKAGTTQITTATVTPGAANEYGETINSAEFTGLSDSGLIYFHVETK